MEREQGRALEDKRTERDGCNRYDVESKLLSRIYQQGM
jgi:hypothetical protein